MAIAPGRAKSRSSSASQEKPSNALPESRVKKRLAELEPMVSSLSDDVRPLAQSLATNIARLSVTMDVCWADYSGRGAVVKYDNGGGQSGVRENPAYGAYIKASREFGAAVGKLVQMVGPGTVAADSLTEWQDSQRERE